MTAPRDRHEGHNQGRDEEDEEGSPGSDISLAGAACQWAGGVQGSAMSLASAGVGAMHFRRHSRPYVTPGLGFCFPSRAVA